MWSASSGVSVRLECSPAVPPLSQDLALALFRIVQESLNNIAKYAGARTVRIALDAEADWLCLTIEDDGVGIAPEVLEKPRSHGIIGMNQRCAQFNGEFSVERVAAGAGTRVSARIPLAVARAAKEQGTGPGLA